MMKKLLTTLSQKWPEYLLEGMVIVASILLAIWLENWNENQKDRSKEQKILQELRIEYQSNLAQLDQKITMRNQIMEASHRILYYIDSPFLAHRDSLMLFMVSILRDPTFDPVQNDLVSSGNLRLLRNDSLRLMLSNWTTEVYQVQEVELEWQKVRTEIGVRVGLELGIARDFTHQLWKDGYTPIEALDQTLSIRRKVNYSQHPTPLTKILKSKELEGLAAYAITWNQVGNIQSAALRKRIKAILSLIEKDLKK
jgi:hypothetical protein